ncbi:hypothetical protein CEXT_813711 [Caerostris extrusa]|uniref:Uncharacterized protein n=1 Tax=Caerostris extrusa TaxID=172846 RepID=A0AAV4U481_CAEEX|nr:hypothetical protein CEXT_813711 [Caerostris extrusa]
MIFNEPSHGECGKNGLGIPPPLHHPISVFILSRLRKSATDLTVSAAVILLFQLSAGCGFVLSKKSTPNDFAMKREWRLLVCCEALVPAWN